MTRGRGLRSSAREVFPGSDAHCEALSGEGSESEQAMEPGAIWQEVGKCTRCGQPIVSGNLRWWKAVRLAPRFHTCICELRAA